MQIATYAVATGALCLVVFRALSGIPFGAIWEFSEAAPHFHVDFRHVLLGGPGSLAPCHKHPSSDFGRTCFYRTSVQSVT